MTSQNSGPDCIGIQTGTGGMGESRPSVPERIDVMARPDGPGSREPDPQAVPALPGFDPSRDELPTDLDRARYDGKPRRLPRDEKDALESFASDIQARLRALADAELASVVRGCLNVSPINCWCWTYAFADVVYPFAAEEIERRRDSDRSGEADETPQSGSAEGESAGRNGIAQPSPSFSDQPHE